MFNHLIFRLMTLERMASDRGCDFVRGSLLYRAREAEKQEVLRHKWLESEKVGHDIGFERAFIDWLIHHRTKWWKAWQASRN